MWKALRRNVRRWSLAIFLAFWLWLKNSISFLRLSDCLLNSRHCHALFFLSISLLKTAPNAAKLPPFRSCHKANLII